MPAGLLLTEWLRDVVSPFRTQIPGKKDKESFFRQGTGQGEPGAPGPAQDGAGSSERKWRFFDRGCSHAERGQLAGHPNRQLMTIRDKCNF